MRIHHDHPGHVADFVRLVDAWLGASPWGLEEADRELARDPLRIVREGGSLLTLSRGGDVVGVCALFRDGPRRLQLARMTVAERERGQGLGARLLVAALDRARQMDASSVYLLTNTALVPAVRLYRRHGFRPVHEGRHPQYARCNLVMERSLGAGDGREVPPAGAQARATP